MCGRFSLYEPSERLVARTSASTRSPPGEPEARLQRGAVPADPLGGLFARRRRRGGSARSSGGSCRAGPRTLAVGYRMINARAETVASAPSFRRAFERRRCLVPANGFFEWYHDPDQKRRRGRPVLRPARRRRLLALGGVWEVWHGPDDQVLRTVAIVTTIANPDVSSVHDRMPVDRRARRLGALARPRGARAGRGRPPAPPGRRGAPRTGRGGRPRERPEARRARSARSGRSCTHGVTLNDLDEVAGVSEPLEPAPAVDSLRTSRKVCKGRRGFGGSMDCNGLAANVRRLRERTSRCGVACVLAPVSGPLLALGSPLGRAALRPRWPPTAGRGQAPRRPPASGNGRRRAGVDG